LILVKVLVCVLEQDPGQLSAARGSQGILLQGLAAPYN